MGSGENELSETDKVTSPLQCKPCKRGIFHNLATIDHTATPYKPHWSSFYECIGLKDMACGKKVRGRGKK